MQVTVLKRQVLFIYYIRKLEKDLTGLKMILKSKMLWSDEYRERVEILLQISPDKWLEM